MEIFSILLIVESFMMVKNLIWSHKSVRIGFAIILLGGAFLFLSRFIDANFLIHYARELHFQYPMQVWEYNQIVSRIDVFRNAAWCVGLVIILLGLCLSWGRPQGLRRFVEETSLHQGRLLFYSLLFFQLTLTSLFLLTEIWIWWGRVDFASGQEDRQQRILLCGKEYAHSLFIKDRFNPEERILLAGDQIDPFFINYYLYPLKLYLYDSRSISPSEVGRSYVLHWMTQKNIDAVLIYTPFSQEPWRVYKVRKKTNDPR